MSKGGETSSSASAQTPAQWASAQSNTAIAAWREADILGFSQAQLKALTAAQMSHITVPWAVPAAVWTADTLNAVPLQYWSKFGTRYRVTTNNGVSRITELSQGSGDSASGKFNWFDDLGYSPASDGFSFSAAVIAGISNDRIAQIGTGLGHNTLSAPQLTPNAGVISASDFNAALTAATASGESVVTWTISGSETAYMFASGWANMGAQFMGALTVSQLGAIAHPETALGAAQFAYLSANQLIALSQMDWSRVSAAQLNATTISAFSGLQTNILREISETTWGGLDKAHTMALNAADIQLLSASTVASMQYLGYALTANVGAVLTVAQVQSIAANCWAQISDSGFLNALSTAALQAIPVSAFANMADAVLASLDSTHVAALTANQAANYPLSKLSDASSAFYRDPVSLNFADFVASDNVNWRRAPASFIKRLTTEQLHLISPAQFATLSSSALAGLTRSQTQSLTLEQIQSLSASQLSAVTYISRRTDVAQQIFTASILTQMSLDFWRRVDSDFLNALSITAFQAITSGQMTVIAANAFNRLDQVHINSLTRTQMLALTAAQVGQVNGAYLTLPFLRGVRLEAFKGLVPEQMRRLHDYLFNTVVSNAFSGGNIVELEAAEMQFATLVASIMDGDDGREAWLKQSVDLLIQLRWLDPAAAANLSASDVQNTYATLNWSWMSGGFLNNITTAVFSQLKASNIAQLNVDAVAILNDAHVQVLTDTQVAAMSGEQLSAIANLGALQASAVQSLSDAQIAGMTQNWGQINTTFLSHMTARQFMALTPSQFGQLNVAQLATTAIDWRLITPEQLNALPLTEFSKLCTGDNPAILGTTTGVLLSLDGEQMAILAQAAASYSIAQKNTLLNRLFGAFTTEQTERLIDLMKNDSAENIVLQTGLVALLAKMDGTTTGISTAIQTLVSLRQMQPSWFNADNLSTVLPVLSARYTDYVNQFYHAVAVPQTLFGYVFNSNVNLKTASSNFRLIQNTQASVDALDFTPFIARLINQANLSLANFIEGARGVFRPVILDSLGSLGRHFSANVVAQLTRRLGTVFIDYMDAHARNGQIDMLNDIGPGLAAAAKEKLTTLMENFLDQVIVREKIPKIEILKRAQASQTIQSLGGLLIMLGAGIGELGRAIESGSDKNLSRKERDGLIASATLSSIAFVAQSLQLGVSVVMQALIRRYTGTPAQAVDAMIAEAFERRLPVEARQGLQDVIDAPAPAVLPEQELARRAVTAVVEVINHEPVNPPLPPVDPPPPPVNPPPSPQRAQIPALENVVLDMRQPAGNEAIVMAHPANPLDNRALLPNSQFRFPATNLSAHADVTLTRYVTKATPNLLSVNESGTAIVIVNLSEIDFASQFVQLGSKEVFSTMAESMQHTVSKESLQEIVTKYRDQTGKEIKEILIRNVSGELPLAKNIRIADAISTANAGRQDIAAGRFILENLDRFAYRVWSNEELQVAQLLPPPGDFSPANSEPDGSPPTLDDPRLSIEALIPKMETIIRTLFGLASEKSLGVWAGEEISQTLVKTLRRIQRFGWTNNMVDDAVLADTLWGEDALNMPELIKRLTKTLPTGDRRLPIDQYIVRASLDRLTQNYLVDVVKNEALRLSPHQTFEATRHYITTEFTRLGIPPIVAAQASIDISATLLLNRAENLSRTSGDAFNGLIEVWRQASNDPALLQDLSIKSYLTSQMESIDWGARSGNPDIGQVNENWVADIWGAVVTAFDNEHIALYNHSGGRVELTELGRMAMNGALRGQANRQASANLTNVLANNILPQLVRNIPNLVSRPKDLDKMLPLRLNGAVNDLKIRIEADYMQIERSLLAYSTGEGPLRGNLNSVALEMSMKRALQRANTALVEHIVTEWASTIIQMQGDPLQIRNWYSYDQSIHKRIHQWLVSLERSLGANAFEPDAFTRVMYDVAATGSNDSLLTELHNRIVTRLRNMNLDQRYLFPATLNQPDRANVMFVAPALPHPPAVVVRPALALFPVGVEPLAGGRNFTPEFTQIVSEMIAWLLIPQSSKAPVVRALNMQNVVDMTSQVVNTLQNRHSEGVGVLDPQDRFPQEIYSEMRHFFLALAEPRQLIEGGVLKRNFQLTADDLAAAVLAKIQNVAEQQGLQAELQRMGDDQLSAEKRLSAAITQRKLLRTQEVLVQGLSDFLQLPLAEADNVSLNLSASTGRSNSQASRSRSNSQASTSSGDSQSYATPPPGPELFGQGAVAIRPEPVAPVAEAPQVDNPPRPASPQEDPNAIVVAEEMDQADAVIRDTEIGRAHNRLNTLKVAVMNFGMLGFAIFSSVVGIAAGIAGFVYAFQSTSLSWQARVLMLSMNGVRVFSSAVMLVASGAQIAANVIKGVQAASEATKIANAGFAIGNVVGITTNIAQIGLQIEAITSATDSTSRLIAGLSVLDATLQLILNVVGTIALAFGPIGIAINLLTFVIAALLPSAAAIATAVTYRESYDDLTGKGLFKEAEIMYLHWQVAAMDASPIVNWTSSIYTAEMKKAQERTMDNAWMDKSGQERLLYSLTNNTELKDNFDSLRAQMYASAAALSQPLVNLSQGLTRATMLMLSQDNLSYFEGEKLATVKLAATFNYLSNSVSRAPKLVSATVDKQLLTLTFNQNLASLNSQLPNLSAFAVKVAGVATTVSGFSLLNNTITLTLASAVSAGQVVTFSYSDTTTGDDSHAVQNLLGKDTASITDHAVVNVNNNSDTRAPLLADAVVQEQSLTLVFDEALNTKSGKIPDRRAFTVTVDGSVMDIYNMNIQDNRVLLSLERAVTSGAAVTVSYNASYGNGALQDANSNLVANLSAVSVDNTSSTATVTASRVGWLQYDNFVASTQGTGSEAASVLNGSDYTVYANEAGANAGTARLRYLSLSNAAGEFDMYSASRATENSDRIWLDASSAQGVSNFAINTHDMTVWGGQGKNSYSLSRQYANASYIVAANSWSGDSNLVSLSGASGDSNQVVNLDYLLTADNISAGLLVTQTPFKVLGSADGLDEVIGSADNQTYYATSNVANVRLTGANANVAVGESAQVSVGVNGRVLVDMDMWRGLNLSQPTTTGVIKGNYGNYSLVNFAPTDTVNDSFIGKLDLRYQIGHLPELGAFTVNAGGTNVAVTQMKISGRTVTLSLASAVQQNQAVSVSYQDASASNDADTLQDLAGNDVGSFSGQVVSNVTADTTAPTFKVATVQGSTLIVRFSEALLQAIKPLAGDFTVKVDGTSVAVSKAAFNDSLSLRLTLASAVSAEKMVSVSYTPTSTSAVQDLAGNAAVSFSSASVVNLANVAAAPGLRSVTANGNVLTLKFDGTLRYTLNDASAFLVTVNNTPVTISSVSVVGTSVLLYLASAVTSEQSVEVSYTAPQQVSDTTTLRDWLGNGVGNLSAQLAENITGQDLTAPTLKYAIVNASSLVLTFSEALNGQAGFTPLPSAFAVRVSGSAVSVTQAVVSGSTVTLSLATAVDYGAAVSLSYTDLSASNDVAVVQDLAGNDTESFSHINVVNNTPDNTAPTLLSATVTGNQLALLFSETLNSNSGYLPALTNMTVNAAGVAVGIVSGSLNGDTATLTLSNAVNADDYVTFNYSAPNNASNTQAFQDLSGNALLSIANFNVSNLTGVDLTPPSFVSAEVNGNTLSLTFSESLASTASFTPSLSAFSVYVDGTLSTISAVTLNGTQALLTLASAVDNTQKVTVSYSQPVNRPIQDGAGNFAASFSGKAASNVTVDNSAPTLSTASVAGALLTLTFSENLATDSSLIPSAKQFTVNVDGAVVDVLSAVVAGKVVSVTLNKAVTAAQAVSVDYTPATTGTNQLQDASGNATVHFSKTVSNWSGLASLQNATVNGTQLTLTFNQELDAMSGHLPPVSAFAVQVAGVNSTVSQLAVNGYTLTLTLDTAVNYGQEVTVNYTDPSTANDVAALQNLAGMDVQTFSEPYTAHNLTPPVADVLAPSLDSAVANGNTVTLTFSEALDAGAGEWLVNYLPDGQYDAQGNPVVTSRLQASGFVNVLGSNSNDSFIIGDQSGLAASRQLNYIQLGNGQGVQVSHYDTSGNLLLAMGSTGQADVVLESGSSLQKLLTTKLVQSDADIVKYKANRDTVTLKSLSSLTAFLAGYEVIDATESSSSLTAQIGEGDHQIKLGGQTVNLQFDKAVSTTSITTHQIPNSWLDYQYFNFNGINADGLWVGLESDGTVLFQARWTNATSGNTDNLNVSYDGTLSNVVMEVGHVLASATSSQLRLDKLIEVMSSPAFSTDPTAASKAIAVSDTSNDGAQTKLYRVTDIVAYSSQPQSSVTS